MDKIKQIDRVRKFRDELKEYYVLCGPRWRARNRRESVEKDVVDKEKAMREKLTEDWGRLERLFNKIGAPTSAYHPLAGVTRPIFDDALSFDFDGTVKGQGLEAAIHSATKAIGLLDALSDAQYRSLLKTTPSVFIGHSFKDEHKNAVTGITNLVSSFPVSVVTGEKPSIVGVTKGVSEKVKGLIDEADIVVAILTKDEPTGGEKMMPSKWVSDEIAYAIGKKKVIIRLVERDVEYKPAISGDAEYIAFDENNLAPAFLKLSEFFNGFLH